MNWFWGFLAFVLMLSVIVVIHEYGHYLAARAFGVHVHEFSLGMGPLLWKKQGKQTQWSIRAIPFGGYCMMAGETDDSQDEDAPDWVKDVPEDEFMNHKKPCQQVVILIAGVVMNFALAALIYIGIALAQGTMPVMQAKVLDVVENTPAASAGLQPGDVFLEVTNGETTEKIDDQNDLSTFINLYPGEVTLTIDRSGEIIEKTLTPEKDEESQTYMMGIHTPVEYVSVPWYRSIAYGLENMWDSATLIFRSLGMLIRGIGYENLSGPIGILDVTAKTASLGILPYLSLIALISLNVGIFNLIPIPALDGGRILIIALEKVFRRRIDPKIVENVIFASMVVLIGLMLYASFNDIMRMIH